MRTLRLIPEHVQRKSNRFIKTTRNQHQFSGYVFMSYCTDVVGVFDFNAFHIIYKRIKSIINFYSEQPPCIMTCASSHTRSVPQTKLHSLIFNFHLSRKAAENRRVITLGNNTTLNKELATLLAAGSLTFLK